MATIRYFIPTARCFSTTSVAYEKLVNAPIRVFGVEGRYAHALYSAAAKKSKLDAVDKDLKDLKSLVAKDPQLADFLKNPLLKKQVKKQAFTDVLKKKKYSDETVRVFDLMGDNGRLKITTSVCEAFGKIMSAHKGEVACTVTTAKPLDDKTKKELTDALKGFLSPKQHLIMDLKVDDALIGGMIVELGDRYVDMSIASKVRYYKDIMQEALMV